MLGNAVFRLLTESTETEVFASVRSERALARFPADMAPRIITNIDVENTDMLARLFDTVRPDVVVNCVGIVKQLSTAKDPLAALPVNAILPHRLARLASLVGARLVHISTDCVFDGARGNYAEEDMPNAADLYGRSKLLGEVDYPNAITLRTSIIGRELDSSHGLVDWFLSQSGSVKGYRRAVFSGLPTVELARVIRDYVLPRPELRGLYHVSAEPIDKYRLLSIVAEVFGKSITIEPYDDFAIDRSLDSSRFRAATGYVPPSWPSLVRAMRDFG